MKDFVGTYTGWIFALIAAAWAIYMKGHSNRVHVTDQHEAELSTMREKIRQLELAQARTESPLMKQVQDLLTAGLHHPDPAHSRQDYLLERLDQMMLTEIELPELNAMLDQRIGDHTTPTTEIEVAKALKAIMPLVVKESSAISAIKRGRVE